MNVVAIRTRKGNWKGIAVNSSLENALKKARSIEDFEHEFSSENVRKELIDYVFLRDGNNILISVSAPSDVKKISDDSFTVTFNFNWLKTVSLDEDVDFSELKEKAAEIRTSKQEEILEKINGLLHEFGYF